MAIKQKYLMTIEDIAKVCHQANKAYCEALGDTSQPSWDEAPEWQRTSAKNGVKFHLQNYGASPRRSHEEWYREKEADGWKYGPVEDPGKKEHPCFMPYSQLPKEQQAKDQLFIGIVNALRHLV
jgi:hypothetical protein